MFLIMLAALQVAVPSDLTGIYSRIDTIGRYPGQAAMCMQVGYTLAPDFTERLKQRAVAEGKAAGASESQVSAWLDEGASRFGSQSQSRRQRTLSVVESEEDPTDAIKSLFAVAYSQCVEMMGDPILSDLIVAPADPVGARVQAEDQLLSGFGSASWQTPHIWAVGELMMAVGACKGQLTSRRHDAFLAAHLNADASDQVSQWIRGKYVEGMRSEAELDLDATQCDRLLATRAAEVTKTR